MEFRRALVKDIPLLTELISRSIGSISSEEYPRETLNRWITSYTKIETLTKKIEDPDSYFILLIEKGVIIGEGILTGCEIHGVYADPESSAKGIGTLIMDHLEEYAGEQKVTEITIDAALTSVGFYLKRNYFETGDMVFDLDGYLSPGRVMRKKLQG